MALKYLMKRRRSLLSTRNEDKVEKLFQELPKIIAIEGKRSLKEYDVKWERIGKNEFEGSRFTFTIEERWKNNLIITHQKIIIGELIG